MSSPYYNKAFYDSQRDGSYRSAIHIVPLVKHWVDVSSVLDVGCGVGTFLRAFQESGVQDVLGIDGDYVARDDLMIESSKFIAHDLGNKISVGRNFDLVMSVEVAEHLPDLVASSFVEMLCSHGNVVLFSAAIPEQGGANHVNEQWPIYWSEKFAQQGYRAFDVLRPVLWNDKDVEFWYAQNCFIFANEEGIRKNPRLAEYANKNEETGLMSIVHPKLYHEKLRSFSNVMKLLGDLASKGGAYEILRTEQGMIELRPVK